MLKASVRRAFVFLLMCFCTHVLADDVESLPTLETGTRAIPIETPLRYPKNEAKMAHEGWVNISYVITKDGSVRDPIVTASSGNREFERAALRSAKRWKFSPATWAGETVEQCDSEHRIIFQMQNSAPGASRRFVQRYKKAQKALTEGDLARADELIGELAESSFNNLYESSRFWILEALVAKSIGDVERSVYALQNAAVGEGHWLEDDVNREMLRIYFWLQVQRQYLSHALELYGELRKLDDGTTDEIDGVVAQIVKLRDGDQSFKIDMELRQAEEDSTGTKLLYRPLRRTFALANIEGSLEGLEIRCERNRAVEVDLVDKEWAIPEHWGKCDVFIMGRAGTKFSVVEYPSAPNIPDI